MSNFSRIPTVNNHNNNLINKFLEKALYEWLLLLLSLVLPLSLEHFSFECRKVIGTALTTLHDWLKTLAPLFHPIRIKTKSNRDALAHVFPRFASATRDLLGVLIGPLYCLCPLSLSGGITLVLVSRHSIENRSIVAVVILVIVVVVVVVVVVVIVMLYQKEFLEINYS